MHITVVADLHGEWPDLDHGDVLIVAGDCTSNDSFSAWKLFLSWFEQQDYRKKILVAGNHDNFCKHWAVSGTFTDEEFERMGIKAEFFDYLCDSGTEFEGVKFWGSPWTLWFNGINPYCTAFTGTEQDLKEKFDKIPNDIDVLITHSPPYGILDQIQDYHSGHTRYCGSISLREKIEDVKPLYIVFGHIHEHGGKMEILKTPVKDITCVNASQMDESYIFIPRPFDFEI